METGVHKESLIKNLTIPLSCAYMHARVREVMFLLFFASDATCRDAPMETMEEAIPWTDAIIRMQTHNYRPW